MGKAIEAKTRRGLIIGLSLLLLVSVGMAIGSFKQPDQVKKEVPAYKYTQQAQVDYQVFFTNNQFFSDASAGPGRGYLTPITNSIETKFNYRYSGEGTAKINGQYEVVANITGYIMKDKKQQSVEREKVKVWERTTILVPATTFSSSEGKVEVDKVVPINLLEFVDFANQVQDKYKSPAEVMELSVHYNTSVNVVTDQGSAKDSVNPVMVIPIKGNAYTVEGTLNDKKEKVISTSEMVDVPGVKTSRIAYSMAGLIFLLLLLGVAFKTSDLQGEPLEMIIRKYGDRIVACEGGVPFPVGDGKMLVSSFEDLVKVADEIGQPILYESIGDSKHAFYVLHDSRVYVYTLEGKKMAANDKQGGGSISAGS